MLELVLETLFPARCVGCGRRGVALCPVCRLALPYLPAGLCPRCAGRRSSRGACRTCQRLSPALVSIRAVCAYDGAARTAVHTFKYRSGRYLAPLLGELLRNSMCRVPLRAEVIVPVPLSAHRRHDRGYNQAALLAEQVAPSVGGTVAEVLVRDDRPAQQTLSAAERQVNLRNAIRCANPEAIRGRRVLLIDDVATTGSSLSACADALAAAGAARISALVFARDL